MKQFWDDILMANETSNACLATVIATEGTAPRKEGSKMLIIGGETLKGAVTIGGCIDAQVIEAAEEVMRTGEPRLLRAELGEEDAFEIGLTCAGALRVLVEPVQAQAGDFSAAAPCSQRWNSVRSFDCDAILSSVDQTS